MSDQALRLRKQKYECHFHKIVDIGNRLRMSMAVLPADSYGKGKAKAKPNLEAKEKYGREAGELPFGLEQFSQKNGTLPSRLQKRKMMRVSNSWTRRWW